MASLLNVRVTVTYLDANATEPLRPEAREAMLRVLESTGNPSSIHRHGRRARSILETARETVAARFGADPADLVFTSGGTEANALALHGLGGTRRIIASAVEHDSIRAAAPDAISVPVQRDGRIDLDCLAALLKAGPALVCLMLANNETGVIQPVAEAAILCRRRGALLHVDAVQAGGRIPFDLRALGAHALALSSHKLGGPTGAGALLLASDAPAIAAHLPGGGQERGRRGGTPALAAIAGFAAACGAAERAGENLSTLRDEAERAAVAAGATVCGAEALRLPNTTSLALPGVRAETQVIALDLAGISVSAGAACSSGKVSASHVLAAMGLGPLAAQAIRVSLPWNATRSDVQAFSAAYGAVAARLRKAGHSAALASRAA